jgi:flotillin
LAQAQLEKLKQEGLGRAAAVEAEGRAEAAKVEAIGLAQARAIEAQGVAEAQAIMKKAGAWKEFTDAAKLQTILEKLPNVLQAAAGIFGAVAAPLGNIDKVVVIEQGNSGDGGTGGIGRIARTGPALIFSLLQQLQALGLDIPTVLSQLSGEGGRLAAAPKPAAEAPGAPKGPAKEK